VLLSSGRIVLVGWLGWSSSMRWAPSGVLGLARVQACGSRNRDRCARFAGREGLGISRGGGGRQLRAATSATSPGWNATMSGRSTSTGTSQASPRSRSGCAGRANAVDGGTLRTTSPGGGTGPVWSSTFALMTGSRKRMPRRLRSPSRRAPRWAGSSAGWARSSRCCGGTCAGWHVIGIRGAPAGRDRAPAAGNVRTPAPVLAGAEEVGDRLAVLPALFHLMWRQELVADLGGVRLSPAALVQAVGVTGGCR
jgi:hypothetical protein